MFEKAKWIKGNSQTKTEFYDQTPAPYLAKGFWLRERPQKAVLNVCGLGEAAYFLNGAVIPDSYRPTCWTNVSKHVIYNVYDVTDILQKGENRFTAMLGHLRSARLETSMQVRLQMIFQLEIIYPDGTTECIVSDDSFKTADSPIVFSSACCGEIWDATRELAGCLEAGYDDSAWENAVITFGPGGAFETTACPPIRKIKESLGIEIHPRVYDFGAVTAGYVRVCVNGKRGSVIKLKYSERLSEDGHVNMGSFSQWKYPDMMNSDMYVLDGTENRIFEQYFSIHGFRYVEVEGEYDSITLTAVTAHNDIKAVADFTCDNEIIRKIHAACCNSILTCCQYTMPDNPRRDYPWLGDIMLSCEANIINFDSYGLLEKIMMDCQDEQRPSGMIPFAAPCLFPEWEQDGFLGPDWGDSVIIHVPYYTYLYTGSTELIRKMWDNMTQSIRYFEGLSEDYIVVESAGTGDWSARKGGCRKTITNTVFFYWDCCMMQEMAQLIGKDAAPYAALASNIRKAFRDRFVKDGRMQAEHVSEWILPAYAGLLEEAEKKIAVEEIAAQIKAEEYSFTFGVLGLRMVFDLLSEYDMTQLLYDTVINDKLPGYAKNVQEGMQTLPELFERDKTPLISHNHHFFAMIDSWFYKWLAGIRYEDTVKRTLLICPKFVEGLHTLSAELRGIRVSYDEEKVLIESPYAFKTAADSEKMYEPGCYTFERAHFSK